MEFDNDLPNLVVWGDLVTPYTPVTPTAISFPTASIESPYTPQSGIDPRRLSESPATGGPSTISPHSHNVLGYPYPVSAFSQDPLHSPPMPRLLPSHPGLDVEVLPEGREDAELIGDEQGDSDSDLDSDDDVFNNDSLLKLRGVAAASGHDGPCRATTSSPPPLSLPTHIRIPTLPPPPKPKGSKPKAKKSSVSPLTCLQVLRKDADSDHPCNSTAKPTPKPMPKPKPTSGRLVHLEKARKSGTKRKPVAKAQVDKTVRLPKPPASKPRARTSRSLVRHCIDPVLRSPSPMSDNRDLGSADAKEGKTTRRPSRLSKVSKPPPPAAKAVRAHPTVSSKAPRKTITVPARAKRAIRGRAASPTPSVAESDGGSDYAPSPKAESLVSIDEGGNDGVEQEAVGWKRSTGKGSGKKRKKGSVKRMSKQHGTGRQEQNQRAQAKYRNKVKDRNHTTTVFAGGIFRLLRGKFSPSTFKQEVAGLGRAYMAELEAMDATFAKSFVQEYVNEA